MKKQKVMVALKTMESVGGLMDLACRVARGMDAKLIAVHVAKVPVGLDLSAESAVLDRPGKELLACARKVACKEFGKISTQLIRARQAAETIVSEAEEQDVDLLILGYQHKNPVVEVLMGSTAQYVARHSPCRVIVEIPAVPHSRHREDPATLALKESNAASSVCRE